MLEILSAVVLTALSIFIGFYVIYYAICWRYNHKTTKKKAKTANNHPTISFIIPVYNEVNVLQRRIENLRELNYPKNKMEIVFVDGGSTDGSIEFLEKQLKQTELLIKTVFQGSRKGFNNAVREGFAQTTGEIICITGAETEYDTEALNLMVQHFKDPKIGAVTGKQKIKNKADGFAPKLEVAYRDLYDFVRAAESNIDSPFDIKGEIAAARRDIVKAVVENSRLATSGCIDCCLNFQGKINGYKTIYEPDAVYYELSPKLMRDSFKQQIRRAATLIENMLAFKNMIFRKEFDAFGMLIMPAHFLMLVVLPYFLILATVGIITLAILNPSNLLFPLLLIVGLFSILVSRRVKAFMKTQLVLIVATLNLFKGTETQKFERLQSARPS
jgi:biofilm PGA synthesis N-glycosyltransferase PgaC